LLVGLDKRCVIQMHFILSLYVRQGVGVVSKYLVPQHMMA